MRKLLLCIIASLFTNLSAQDVAQRIADVMFFVEDKRITKARKKIREEVKDPGKVVLALVDFNREEIFYLARSVSAEDIFNTEKSITSYSLVKVGYGDKQKKRLVKHINHEQMTAIVIVADGLVRKARYGVFSPDDLGEASESYLLLSKAYNKGEFFGWFRLSEIISPKRGTKSWAFVEDLKNLTEHEQRKTER